jgi:hypothetical protein
MKVTFRGGPWNGIAIDLPKLPTWINFGVDVWTGGDDAIPICDTKVLSEPHDFTYLLEKDANGNLRYVLRIIEEP